MDWSETLPPSCPPSDAVSTEGYTVYRIALSNPPTHFDFESHRSKFPDRVFPVGECRARSLSVYNNLQATEMITKLPTFKDKEIHIIKLDLKREDGLILEVGQPHHHSWWKTTSFAVIP